MSTTEHVGEVSKYAMDAVAAGITMGVFVSILPPLAAILTIIWTALRIWESPTVQGLVGKRKKEPTDVIDQ